MKEMKEIDKDGESGIGFGAGMIFAAVLFQISAGLSRYGYCDLNYALSSMTVGVVVSGAFIIIMVHTYRRD